MKPVNLKGLAAAIAVAVVAAAALGAAAAQGYKLAPWATSNTQTATPQQGYTVQATQQAGCSVEWKWGKEFGKKQQIMIKHNDEREDDDDEYGHYGFARCTANVTMWNGTATVAWADPAKRLLGLQLENGRNVTVALAREYVRASDGALVYGGWIAEAAKAAGTVWVKVAGVNGHGVIVEIKVSDQDYIIPHAYGSS